MEELLNWMEYIEDIRQARKVRHKLNNHRLKPVGYCGLKAAFLRLKGALRAEALFLP